MLVAFVLWPSVASAEQITKQMCVDSHLKAQSQKLEGHLVESLQNLRTCANKACPAIVQRDCVQWLEEIQREVPTVIFDASDGTGPLKEVRVTQDGHVLAASIDGAALEIDPGTYDFVFEAADGRRRRIKVLIRQGDHNRSVAVDFSESHDQDDAWIVRVPPAARVSGGVALVATALGAALGASALISQANALDRCAPACDEGVSESIETRAAIADVAGGVALIAGVLTAVSVVRASRPGHTRSSARVAAVLGASHESAFFAVRREF